MLLNCCKVRVQFRFTLNRKHTKNLFCFWECGDEVITYEGCSAVWDPNVVHPSRHRDGGDLVWQHVAHRKTQTVTLSCSGRERQVFILWHPDIEETPLRLPLAPLQPTQKNALDGLLLQFKNYTFSLQVEVNDCSQTSAWHKLNYLKSWLSSLLSHLWAYESKKIFQHPKVTFMTTVAEWCNARYKLLSSTRLELMP